MKSVSLCFKKRAPGVVLVAVISGACSMTLPIPDTPTKQEREYPPLYRPLTDDEKQLLIEQHKGDGVAYLQEELFTRSEVKSGNDVPGVFVPAGDITKQRSKNARGAGSDQLGFEVLQADGNKKHFLVFKKGPRYFAADGWRYCRSLEQQSARASSQWAGWGIPALALGLPAGTAGTVLMVAESTRDEADSGKLLASLGLAAGGYALSFFGVFALDRSAAGATASAEAGRGIQKDASADAYKACSDARATWAASRERSIEQVKAERDHYRELAESRLRKSDEGGAGGTEGAAEEAAGTGGDDSGGAGGEGGGT